MVIDPSFIVNLRGKSYPVFAGVLDAATRAGLKSLTTRIVQIPSPENGMMAIVTARAEFEDGRVFEDVGDCSPLTTSAQLAPAALRLASTRAKGRVLRDAVNVGQTLLEELPDLDAVPEVPERPAVPSARPGGAREDGAGAAPLCETRGCGKPLTKGQYEVSLRAYGRPLCPTCQKRAVKREVATS